MRETMPRVIESDVPPAGKPYASTGSFTCGRALARGSAGRVAKKDSSSSLSTARSMPGAKATTVAETLSPDWLPCTSTWLAYATTCALVRMRLPSITTPVPEISRGADLVHGFATSGPRTVENTLTTAFSACVLSGEAASPSFLGAAWAAAMRPTIRKKLRGQRTVAGIEDPVGSRGSDDSD